MLIPYNSMNLSTNWQSTQCSLNRAMPWQYIKKPEWRKDHVAMLVGSLQSLM
jgi:hypothetical protein